VELINRACCVVSPSLNVFKARLDVHLRDNRDLHKPRLFFPYFRPLRVLSSQIAQTYWALRLPVPPIVRARCGLPAEAPQENRKPFGEGPSYRFCKGPRLRPNEGTPHLPAIGPHIQQLLQIPTLHNPRLQPTPDPSAVFFVNYGLAGGFFG